MVMRLTTRAFNGGLAAFAAGAAGFAVFAMPDALFDRLASLVGLAGLDTGLRPVIATAVGAMVFLPVMMLLRVFDRPSATTPHVVEGEVEEDWTAPRLRRADTHPDAPAPRPLLAGKDLGEPVEDIPAIDHGEPASDADPAPTEVEEPAPLKRILMRTSLTLPEPTGPVSPVREKSRAEPPEEPHETFETPASEAIESEQPVAEVRQEEPGQEEPIQEEQPPEEYAPVESAHEESALPEAAPDEPSAQTEEQIVPMSLLDRLAVAQDGNVGAQRLLRRLGDDFGGCEWPLPAGDANESDAESEDRLRGVLDDLQRMAQRNAG
jgi:hypothetical protein